MRAFHSTFYRPDNATLVVVGDFDQKQLDSWWTNTSVESPNLIALFHELQSKSLSGSPKEGHGVRAKRTATSDSLTYLAPAVKMMMLMRCGYGGDTYRRRVLTTLPSAGLPTADCAGSVRQADLA